MNFEIGQTLEQLETPQLLIDLDVVDANLDRMFLAFQNRPVSVRVHFKSLKCGGLARYIAARHPCGFLSAKLNEAEVLADAGLTDILVANQIVGLGKLDRLAKLACRARVRVLVDDAENVGQMSLAAQKANVVLGVLVEVNIGMNRCGVEPGPQALELARRIVSAPGLEFLGLQGYDGHLQLIADSLERREKCLKGMEQLIGTRRLIEASGISVKVVTGAGTGTSEFVGNYKGVTEIQPGSFVLMDSIYHGVRPEFGRALSILTTVISKKPSWYVLDAGSKAISKDFGSPQIKGRSQDTVIKLSEEHTSVESRDEGVIPGFRMEVFPAHCCATMNLHRRCIAIRKGRVEAVWPIEASGRYD